MAKLKIHSDGPAKGPSLRGALYFYTRGGEVIAAKWPRKRGKAKTPKHRQQTQWFTAVRKGMKYAIPQQQILAMNATHGTPLLPGDVLMSAAAGRFTTVRIADGPTYRSYRAMTDVSRSLDIITDIPGQMLVRAEQGWVGVPFAQANFQWTWNFSHELNGASLSSSEYAWKGCAFWPSVDLEITDLASWFWAYDGATYQAAIVQWDENDVINAIDKSNQVVSDWEGERTFVFNLSKSLVAGQQYAIMFGCTSRADDDPMWINFNFPSSWLFPCRNINAPRIAKANPQIGDTLNRINDDYQVPSGINFMF